MGMHVCACHAGSTGQMQSGSRGHGHGSANGAAGGLGRHHTQSPSPAPPPPQSDSEDEGSDGYAQGAPACMYDVAPARIPDVARRWPRVHGCWGREGCKAAASAWLRAGGCECMVWRGGRARRTSQVP
eukprot:350659-Chlamydomonas_euryale.AAC.7